MGNNVNKKVLDEISSEDTLQDDPASQVLVDKFVIRLPEGLRNQIKELSELNHRSMNSEIIMVLQKHVQLHLMGPQEGKSENSMAEQEVNKRLEDLKESLLQLMS